MFIFNGKLSYGGYDFYLTHFPRNIPKTWRGWGIHGHVHNNDLENYPFINSENKTVNVGVEVLDYRPLDLDCLVGMLDEGRNREFLWGE